MGQIRNVYKIFVGKPEGMKSLRRLGLDGRIMLELIVRK
jgi:hypothetical protein